MVLSCTRKTLQQRGEKKGATLALTCQQSGDRNEDDKASHPGVVPDHPAEPGGRVRSGIAALVLTVAAADAG